jgi:DUF4097 and DUF4098 domain-containing protein YvlB
MREHTFEMTRDPSLKVQVQAGEIDVEAVPGTEASVRLTPIVDDADSRDAIELAHVELHGDELVVEVKEKRLRFGSHPQVRAEIRCPDGTRARLHTASGDIRARGRLGDTKTHVASGDVELERVDGRFDAHSASGDVAVGSVRGDADVHSASGGLELGHTEGAVRVRSASGDVTLADAGAGPIRVHSASGDVRVAVRAGRRVAVDVRTVSGEASSEIPLDEGGGDVGDAPLVEIQVNGVSGDVRIERAAEVPALELEA